MLEKKAKFNSTIDVIHNPKFETGMFDYIKSLNLKIASVDETKIPKINKDGNSPEFDLEAEVREHPDFLFVKIFAIKANETNDNGDWFSTEELKKAYSTFVDAPIFTNHQNTDIEKAKGKVVHSWYDDEKDGIMIIARIDTVAYPDLARGIKTGYMLGTSMGCLTPECRILMHNGTYLPIKDVQVGDRVYTHTGEIKEVKNVQIRLFDGLIKKINMEGYISPIEITPNHKMMTLKKQELCACGCGGILPVKKKKALGWKSKYSKRFLNGHFQNVWNTNKYAKTHKNELKEKMQDRREFTVNDLDWVPSGEMKKNDILLLPVRKNAKQPQDIDCTVEKCRLIGYFLAEGCYSRLGGELYSVTFSFGLDEKDTYVREVADLMKMVFPNCRPCIIPRKKGNACLVVVRNKEIAKWFYELCGEYSHKKKLADRVLSWPDHYLKHLIGAYLNGDGCGSARRPDERTGSVVQTLNGTSVSEDLISQIHLMLFKVGVYNRVCADVNSKSVEIKKAVNYGMTTVTRQLLGNEVTMDIRPSYRIEIPHHDMDKLEKYSSYVRVPRHVRDYSNLKFIDVDENTTYIGRRISSVEEYPYNGTVYNLQIEDDYSYVVEDIAVKNCQVQYSLCSICHNMSTKPNEYCGHIKEQKGKKLSGKTECRYHDHGTEDHCPLCGSTKQESRIIKYENQDVHEKNYNLRFIEDSVVSQPACHDCGITDIIDTSKFLKKVAEINAMLPGLLKAASTTPISCTNTSCTRLCNEQDSETIMKVLNQINVIANNIQEVEKYNVLLNKTSSINLESLSKYAGAQEIKDLRTAIDLIGNVSKKMIDQKGQIDLEFTSEIIDALAKLQETTDELEQQGFSRLPSPEETTGTTEIPPVGTDVAGTTGTPAPLTPTAPGGVNPAVGTSKVNTGPTETGVGSVTGPMASVGKNWLKVARNKKITLAPGFKKTHKINLNKAK